MLSAGALFHRDNVAGLALRGGDVAFLAVDGDVSVADELACSVAAVGEAEAIDDVVEAALQHLEKDFAGDAAAAGGLFKEPAELLFEHAVLIPEFLLFREGDGIVGELLASAAGTVLAGSEAAAFKGFGGSEDRDSEAAADLVFGACVACHK